MYLIQRDYAKVEETFSEITTIFGCPSARCFSCVVLAYFAEKDYEKAEGVARTLKKFGISMDLDFLNEVCSDLDNATQEAMEVIFRWFDSENLSPCPTSYTNLISYAAACQAYRVVANLFSDSVHRGIFLPAHAMSHVIEAYLIFKNFKMADLAYERYLRGKFANSSDSVAEKNILESMFSAYTEILHTEKAEQVLTLMAGQNFGVHVRHYNRLITSYRILGEYSNAAAVFSRMEASGIAPDRESYIEMQKVFGDSMSELTRSLSKNLGDRTAEWRKIVPRQQLVILDRAESLYERMTENFGEDFSADIKMLEIYRDSQNPERFKDLLSKMKKKPDFREDFEILALNFEVYANSGDFTKSEEIFYRIISENAKFSQPREKERVRSMCERLATLFVEKKVDLRNSVKLSKNIEKFSIPASFLTLKILSEVCEKYLKQSPHVWKKSAKLREARFEEEDRERRRKLRRPYGQKELEEEQQLASKLEEGRWRDSWLGRMETAMKLERHRRRENRAIDSAQGGGRGEGEEDEEEGGRLPTLRVQSSRDQEDKRPPKEDEEEGEEEAGGREEVALLRGFKHSLRDTFLYADNKVEDFCALSLSHDPAPPSSEKVSAAPSGSPPPSSLRRRGRVEEESGEREGEIEEWTIRLSEFLKISEYEKAYRLFRKMAPRFFNFSLGRLGPEGGKADEGELEEEGGLGSLSLPSLSPSPSPSFRFPVLVTPPPAPPALPPTSPRSPFNPLVFPLAPSLPLPPPPSPSLNDEPTPSSLSPPSSSFSSSSPPSKQVCRLALNQGLYVCCKLLLDSESERIFSEMESRGVLPDTEVNKI
jgi:pentatricopeptide repeat protein